ncbi:hypothetical protein ACTI_13840 [Actinoplanes sp. OR16]|nr:hypothetical protein ACTI_13840 [Actinoplanes sp. OR16]
MKGKLIRCHGHLPGPLPVPYGVMVNYLHLECNFLALLVNHLQSPCYKKMSHQLNREITQPSRTRPPAAHAAVPSARVPPIHPLPTRPPHARPARPLRALPSV